MGFLPIHSMPKPFPSWERVKVTVSKPIKGALEANLYFRCNRVIITTLAFLEGPSLPLPLASFSEATWVEQGAVMTGNKPPAP